MNEQVILQQLLMLLEQEGVLVRNEALGGSGGGLCTVGGKNVFFADTQAPTHEMAVMASEAVGRLVDIETIYLRPEIREFIEKCISTG